MLGILATSSEADSETLEEVFWRVCDVIQSVLAAESNESETVGEIRE
jgi:hypothetical protein